VVALEAAIGRDQPLFAAAAVAVPEVDLFVISSRAAVDVGAVGIGVFGPQLAFGCVDELLVVAAVAVPDLDLGAVAGARSAHIHTLVAAVERAQLEVARQRASHAHIGNSIAEGVGGVVVAPDRTDAMGHREVVIDEGIGVVDVVAPDVEDLLVLGRAVGRDLVVILGRDIGAHDRLRGAVRDAIDGAARVQLVGLGLDIGTEEAVGQPFGRLAQDVVDAVALGLIHKADLAARIGHNNLALEVVQKRPTVVTHRLTQTHAAAGIGRASRILVQVVASIHCAAENALDLLVEHVNFVSLPSIERVPRGFHIDKDQNRPFVAVAAQPVFDVV